jgi:hypothetical protein
MLPFAGGDDRIAVEKTDVTAFPTVKIAGLRKYRCRRKKNGKSKHPE